ncbi:hypothetical protein ACN47E_007737 [Coniothyrium glycines]
MAGDRKGSDIPNRSGVKRGAKLVAKSVQTSTSSIVTPPKAAIATPTVKNDEVHRRRHLLNDMLGRKDAGEVIQRTETADTRPARHEEDITQRLQEASQGKDISTARIAELEKSLTIAYQERQLLQEELEILKRQQYAGSQSHEHARHYQSESSAGPQNLHYEASMSQQQSSEARRKTERSNDELLRQNYELLYKVAHLQDQLMSQNSAEHSYNSAAREAEWNQLRMRLHSTEKESQERHQQLLLLKSSISSLTRLDEQITDTELVDSFRQIANRVREWVVTNLRRSKLVLADISPETALILTSVIGQCEGHQIMDKFALFQAIIGNAITQIVQEPFIFGSPDTAPFSVVRACAEILRGNREWTRATIRAIDSIDSGDVLKQGVKVALHRDVGEIVHLLFELTSVNLSTHAQSALFDILDAAADLQRTLALQKALYRLSFYRSGRVQVKFDSAKMDIINDLDVDEDDDMLTDQTFLFCVFPCVEKFGDERGEHLERRNVLLKAKVCCGVG